MLYPNSDTTDNLVLRLLFTSQFFSPWLLLAGIAFFLFLFVFRSLNWPLCPVNEYDLSPGKYLNINFAVNTLTKNVIFVSLLAQTFLKKKALPKKQGFSFSAKRF